MRLGISRTSLIFAKLIRTLLPSFTGLIFAISPITPVLKFHAVFRSLRFRAECRTRLRDVIHSSLSKSRSPYAVSKVFLAFFRKIWYNKSVFRGILPIIKQFIIIHKSYVCQPFFEVWHIFLQIFGFLLIFDKNVTPPCDLETHGGVVLCCQLMRVMAGGYGIRPYNLIWSEV